MALDFQMLVDAHYQALYRFAWSLAKNEADACDLTQQTFYRWATKGDSLLDQTKVKSWLFTSLYREFLNQNRRTTRFPHIEIGELVESGGAEPSVQPETGGRQMDSRSAVDHLAEIDESYRAPLTLFYLEELSYKEIAEVLDIPIGTVMSRLSRGKAILRERLESSANQKIVPIPKQRGKEAK